MREIFFFSSRRRHTRWPRDWSSDVCSSDLRSVADARLKLSKTVVFTGQVIATDLQDPTGSRLSGTGIYAELRSEERRVGKECRSRCWPERLTKTQTLMINARRVDEPATSAP